MNSHLTDRKKNQAPKVSAIVKPFSTQQLGRRTEGALQEIEECFRLAFENANIGMCLVSLQGQLLKVNPQMCEIFGYSQEELEGMTVNDIAHPEDVNISPSFIHRATSGNIGYTQFEKRYFHKDGRIVWGQVSSSLVRDSHGLPQYFISHVQDITNRKRAEVELSESEERYRSLAQSARDAIFTLSPSGTITSLNPAFERITGWSCAEWTGQSFTSIIHPGDLPTAMELYQRALQGEIPTLFELRICLKSGEYGIGEFTITPQINHGTLKGFIGIARDITIRKQEEEKLKFRVEFEKLIMTISTRFINLTPADIDKEITYTLQKIGEFAEVDRSYVFIFQKEGERMSNTHEWCAPEIQPQIQRLQRIIVDQELPYFARIIKNREVFYVPRVADLPEEAQAEKKEFELEKIQSLICVPIIHRDTLIGFLGFDSVKIEKSWSEDVISLLKIVGEMIGNAIAKKHVEETLLESELKFRDLLENANDLIQSVRMDASFIYVNRAWREVLGYEEEDIQNLHLSDIIHPNSRAHCMEVFQRLMAGENINHVEAEFLTKKGEAITVEGSVNCLFKDGHPVATRGIFRNITERKRAEEMLRKSEEGYRTILENIEDGYYEVDLAGNLTFFNDSLCRMLGYTSDEMIGMSNKQYTNEESRKKLFQAFNKVYRTGEPTKEFDWEVFRKDGKIVFGEVSVSLVKDSEGHPVGFRGIARDITKRKQVEEEIRHTLSLLNATLESTADGILVVDREGKIESFNQKFIQMWRIPESVISSKDDDQALAFVLDQLKDPEGFLSKVKELYNQPSAESFDLLEFKDGRVFERYSKPQQIGTQSVGRVWSFRDVTEQMNAEKELLQEKKRFQTLSEQAPFGMLMIDQDGIFKYMNPKFRELFGYDLTEVPDGKTWFRKAYPDQEYRYHVIKTWIKDLDRIKQKEKTNEVFTVVCKDGTHKNINFISVKLDTGEYLVTCEDISERIHTEEALRKSEAEAMRLAQENEVVAEIGQIIGSTLNIEEVYERFVEEANKLIHSDRIAINLVTLEKGRTTIAYNRGVAVPHRKVGEAVSLAGTFTEEVVRTRKGQIVQGDEKEIANRFPGLIFSIRMGLRSMMSVPLFSKDEVIGVLNFRSFKVNAYSERDLQLAERIGNQIAGAIANARLYKEQIEARAQMDHLQEQLRQSQKMEAIGQLAGGIAHDFNNLLTVIKGYSQLSLLEIKDNVPLKENIEEIQKASERASNLTRQLLAFSRRQILDFKVVNLNIIIQDLDKMLHRILGEDIELNYILTEEIGKVRIDPGQIEQVIMNLAVNARDAMPSGGKLIIETSDEELDEAYAHTHVGITPGHYIRLTVSDTGSGMSPEVRERAFEPFFSTKERGKGTGLGLSTVYGIVKQSGGNIWIYSESGKGTTFKIYLPRVDAPLDSSIDERDAQGIPRGNETILVVEDEEKVRELTLRILKKQGYRVLEARDGNEALSLIKEREESIDLVLTDMVMPGMSGRQLADQLKTMNQELKMLYMSGYTENAITHEGILEEGTHYIQKPFTLEKLARKVRQVLAN